MFEDLFAPPEATPLSVDNYHEAARRLSFMPRRYLVTAAPFKEAALTRFNNVNREAVQVANKYNRRHPDAWPMIVVGMELVFNDEHFVVRRIQNKIWLTPEGFDLRNGIARMSLFNQDLYLLKYKTKVVGSTTSGDLEVKVVNPAHRQYLRTLTLPSQEVIDANPLVSQQELTSANAGRPGSD